MWTRLEGQKDGGVGYGASQDCERSAVLLSNQMMPAELEWP